LGLQLEGDRLKQRIQHRAEEMVEMGFVEEVKSLVSQYGENLPLLKTLGYQEMIQYLLGNISLDEAIALTVLHTGQFAKRQRTWFRAIPEIEWFDADSPDLLEQVWKRIQVFLNLHHN
jgi:tRNA dimethylallyltransferase